MLKSNTGAQHSSCQHKAKESRRLACISARKGHSTATGSTKGLIYRNHSIQGFSHSKSVN
eukprot:3902561-Amphidinium_carterae.1